MREPVRMAACRMQFCFDETRGDCVDADTLVGNFAGKADGEAVDRALGCGVVNPFAGASGAGRER